MSSSSIYGSAAAPITINGLASGINTNSIITSMTQDEQNVVSQYQAQQSTLNGQLTEWQTLNASLSGLQSISQSLSDSSAFNTTQAAIDQTNVASVAANPGASPGTYTLTVNSLAQSQEVLSSGQTSSSVPLNISGSFVLNGKTISVASTDTLSTIVSSINSASAGVSASLVNSGTGNYQIALSSSSTGAINAISASDVGSGTVLESLGLLPSTGATQSLRQTVTTASGGSGAGSLQLANASQDVGTLMGDASGQAASGTVKIGGTSVAINLNTMSLSDIANAINSAGITGVQAQVVGIPGSNGQVSASSPVQLQIVSTSSGQPVTAASFSDSGGVLASLGIVQTGFANQKSTAQDASFDVNGVGFTRASNTVSDAIPNVTMTLQTTNNSSTSTPANISVTADTSSAGGSISNFVTAYNAVVDAINAQESFSYNSAAAPGVAQTAPPLFGNATLSSVHQELQAMTDVTSGSSSLASIGITINSTGDMVVNNTTLQNALVSNPTQVANLFASAGTSSNSAISFIAAGTNTQSSSSQGYNVDITQASSPATVTGSTPFQTLTQPETLTFTNGLFGSGNSSITLPTGSTLQNAIDAINGNSTIDQFLYASQNAAGDLQLSSIGYGSNQSFTVTSNMSGTGTTGIGTTGLTGTGTDVAGTINGEPATGSGQTLTGSSTSTTVAGLVIKYAGTATGSVGSIVVTQGLANELDTYIGSVTNTTNGGIQEAQNAVSSQITAINQQITQTQTYVTNEEQTLQAQFAAMESAISSLKNQQAELNAYTNLNTTSGSSSTTSSTGSTTGTGTLG